MDKSIQVMNLGVFAKTNHFTLKSMILMRSFMYYHTIPFSFGLLKGCF